MATSRRQALKILAGGAGAAALGTSVVAAAAGHEEPRPVPPDAVGMLYDTTLCIGCKACVAACTEANGLKPDTGTSGGLRQEPPELNAQTKNIIKAWQEPGGHARSFIKRQCMHCVDPACTSACMMGALQKGPRGIVYWTGDNCVGCRYCQIACPYNVPKFEWTTVNPKIVKCEMCRHLIAQGGGPACCKVCPRGAVIYGSREELLAEAKRRIAEHPGRYVEDRVYGETEGGGTQVLYLAHVPFEALGLPALGTESLPAHVHKVQGTIYKGFLAPVLLYGACVAAISHNRKREAAEIAAAHGEDHR